MIYWKRCNPDCTEQEKKACGARDILEIETSSETILADLRQGMNNQTHWTSINRKLGKITPYIK